MISNARKFSLREVSSIVRKITRTEFKLHYGIPLADYDFTEEEARIYRDSISQEDFKDCLKINHNLYKVQNHLSRKINRMLLCSQNHVDYKVLFLTFTFNDNALNSLSEETRRRYISYWLNSQNVTDFNANIDFGAKNHREHYHALVLTNHNLDLVSWNYGTINCQVVHDYKNKALAKYIKKFENHAMKDTTENMRIIYKRNLDVSYPEKTLFEKLAFLQPEQATKKYLSNGTILVTPVELIF